MSEISYSIPDNMTPAQRFYKYFNNEYRVSNDISYPQSKNGFVKEFITHTPAIVDELETNLIKHEIHEFYIKVKNLKYLCEYSEEFNRYWLLMRSLSGGLKRLLVEPTKEHATDVYVYYYSNYGGRRKLRNESWFENHRWEFLDRLSAISNDEELNDFILEKIDVLTSYFQFYKKELYYFSQELKRLIE
ncbi:hypothetical protein [uncultured Sunxiuqinia sp.]|uniref:hypothetical protein n=1 Tax=uncultured Sunxiuqinia sp. TaxID=1573825 RepID=UPI002AA71F38|nr:hypothetical protein [uncultured Sunxiuqinia sp.]